MINSVTIRMVSDRLSSFGRDSQELLPELVSRLIKDSVHHDAIKRFRFPCGDAISLTGPDGTLVVDDDLVHEFVPSGISLWEMGTSARPATKAEQDFKTSEKKLADAFPDLDFQVTPDMATFCFVTSQRWDYVKWVRDKRDGSDWKSVKVLDAVDLQEWLNECPSVMLWFAETCGLPVEGIYNAEQLLRWLGIRFGMDSSPPELVIAGREDNEQQVKDKVCSSSADARVSGESAEEAAAFIAATALRNPNDFGNQPPILFVDSRADVAQLAAYTQDIILTPLDSEAEERIRNLEGRRRRLLRAEAKEGDASSRGHADVTLARCRSEALSKCLEDAFGMPKHKIQQVVTDCRGSLIALFWLLGSGPIGVPRWATRKDATTHASLMLAGSWIGSNENDQRIVRDLAQCEYRNVETLLQSATTPEGPWMHRGEEWLCTSKEFVWRQLIGKVTETMLKSFHEAVNDVLGEKDPALELPLDKRPMANILGKTQRYSHSLRRGLADSIARLAVFKSNGQGAANRAVHTLLDPEHPEAVDRWLSLADVLSELAEASPSVFLECLDQMLTAGDAARFFQDSDGSDPLFGVTSVHTYVLWALERLAWQKEYFPRVLNILARLAQIDPGGRTSNRPIGSLDTILKPWCPRHTIPLVESVDALQMLHRTAPEIAWTVAIGLLPESHDVSMSTPEPVYREHPGERTVTLKEYWAFIEGLVKAMFEWAASDPKKWADIVEAYPEVRRGYPELGEEVTGALRKVPVTAWDTETKATVYEALRKIISHHREYPEAEWSLPAVDLEELESQLDRFEPGDQVLVYATLFSWNPTITDAPAKRFEDGWDEWVAERRTEAIKKVYDQGGADNIGRLADLAEQPSFVGQALAKLSLDSSDIASLLSEGLSEDPAQSPVSPRAQLARGYVWQKYRDEGDPWLDRFVKDSRINWSGAAYANVAVQVPGSPELWNRLEAWGKEADGQYWKTVPIQWLPHDQWERALKKLQDVKRGWSCFELIAWIVDERHSKKVTVAKPDAETVIGVLRGALEAERQGTEPLGGRGSMLSHHVEAVFSYLDGLDVEPDRMAKLEWEWLRVLEHTGRGTKELHRQITSIPELFVDILKMVFRGENEDAEDALDEDQDKEARSAMALQAYRLLENLKTIPGQSPTGQHGPVDPVALKEWVAESRELAKNADRLDVCEIRIGNMLSHAPGSPDGTWPCVEVRDLIEDVASPNLEGGFETGVYNQRGAHFRGPDGKAEHDLAKKYRDFAEKVRTKWPRTAGVLDSLARGYEAEARDWDEQSEWRGYER